MTTDSINAEFGVQFSDTCELMPEVHDESTLSISDDDWDLFAQTPSKRQQRCLIATTGISPLTLSKYSGTHKGDWLKEL
ncbi:hypothetical protein WDW86_05310 [Bdellovibrionota bacterium FG-2]